MIHVIGIGLLVLMLLMRRRSPRLPPGPLGLPLLGNIFQLSQKPLALWLFELGKIYGPLFTLRLIRRRIVFISSADIAIDLLDKRLSLYSDRPDMPMVALIGRAHSVLFEHYNERFRRYRKILHQSLNSRAVKDYHQLQEDEACAYLSRLLDDSDRFMVHTEHIISTVIFAISYGHRIESDNDPFLDMARQVRHMTTVASKPGRWLVDLLPWLARLPRWLPGMSFRAWADLSRSRCEMYLQHPVDFVRKKMLEGTARPCFLTSLLETYPCTNPATAEEEDIVRQVSGSLFAGGSDPPHSMVLSFILFMTLNPMVQRRAQEEIDAVIGRARLPQVNDRERLPFLDCITQEVLRLAPPVPIAPHCAMADDKYSDFDIPKGTSVYANIWAMCHDPLVYPDPDTFDPTRFIGNDGTPAQPDPRRITFGFGARACPGRHLAYNGVFIMMVHLLWAFDIRPELDEMGHPVLPKLDFTFGHVSLPHPFRCQFIPRFEEVSDVVRGRRVD